MLKYFIIIWRKNILSYDLFSDDIISLLRNNMFEFFIYYMVKSLFLII